MVASSTTCSERWLLTEETPGPLPRPGLRLTGIFVGVVALGLAVAWLFSGGTVTVAEIGKPAPDFTVELLAGGQFSLSEQVQTDDRPILLNMWASWCAPCRTETPEISAFAKDHPGIKVIGVAVDDVDSASREFADEFEPSYDLAFGNSDFEDAYPKLGLPVTYVISADGILKNVFNGIVDTKTLEDLFST